MRYYYGCRTPEPRVWVVSPRTFHTLPLVKVHSWGQFAWGTTLADAENLAYSVLVEWAHRRFIPPTLEKLLENAYHDFADQFFVQNRDADWILRDRQITQWIHFWQLVYRTQHVLPL